MKIENYPTSIINLASKNHNYRVAVGDSPSHQEAQVFGLKYLRSAYGLKDEQTSSITEPGYALHVTK